MLKGVLKVMIRVSDEARFLRETYQFQLTTLSDILLIAGHICSKPTANRSNAYSNVILNTTDDWIHPEYPHFRD